MDKLADNYLMIKVQEGHINFVTLLFERYKKMLYGYFCNQTSDKVFSEDLVQATFYRLIKYKHNYKSGDNFKAWLFTIGRNAMIDEIRKNKRNNHQAMEPNIDKVDESAHADHNIHQKDISNILSQALSKLDSEKREILYLVKIQEKKYKEVAQILSIKESAVKSKVFRAIKELQNHYAHLNYNF